MYNLITFSVSVFDFILCNGDDWMDGLVYDTVEVGYTI